MVLEPSSQRKKSDNRKKLECSKSHALKLALPLQLKLRIEVQTRRRIYYKECCYETPPSHACWLGICTVSHHRHRRGSITIIHVPIPYSCPIYLSRTPIRDAKCQPYTLISPQHPDPMSNVQPVNECEKSERRAMKRKSLCVPIRLRMVAN